MIYNSTLVILQLTEVFENEQIIKAYQHIQSPFSKVAFISLWDHRIIYLKDIDSISSLNFDPPLLPITTRSRFTLGIFAFSATTDIPLTMCTQKFEYYGVESKSNLKRI
jgi:hypothetical protein